MRLRPDREREREVSGVRRGGAGVRRPRWRTAVLWAGCSMCVLIAVAFVLSGSHPSGLQFTAQGPTVGVVEGCWFIVWIRIGSGTFFTIPTGTLHQHRMPSWELWNNWSVLGLTPGRVFIPLYAVFAAVAIPTLLVWRFWPNEVIGYSTPRPDIGGQPDLLDESLLEKQRQRAPFWTKV